MSYNEKMNNNYARVAGMVMEPLSYSHSFYGEKFYKTKLAIKRKSEVYDMIPLLISERLLINLTVEDKSYILVNGEFRSKNIDSKLKLFVWAKEVKILSEELNINELTLKGTICKEPIYRCTPLGKKITDLLLAVNRPNYKSDYLPSVVWGRNALFTATLGIGDKVSVGGRIQSRDYLKRIVNDENEIVFITKTAYEVSTRYIELLNDD